MKARALAIALLLLPAAAVAAENLVVPRDLYELIKSEGCEQISDFFNDRVSAEREYSLLLRFDDSKNALAHCPKRIDGIKFIGGLTFTTVNEPANQYYFIGSRKKVGDATTVCV
jgi:hypothetical protein